MRSCSSTPGPCDEADALDRERAEKGPRGPLHGIPVLVKDNYDTAGMPTSGGALGLATLQPAADAFQVKRLRDAGAVILGKTTMHELAAGITTISSLTDQTRNPYDLQRVPGGSSGGTGAAIGASFAAAGMGSDTCGSIRIPAANQNLVGLRGTQGLSSRTGVMPLSSTQDIAGPLARTVTDLAIMLDATVGPDPADPITAEGASHIPKTYRESLQADGLKGARIGVLRALFGTAPEDEEVAGIVRKAVDALKAQGAEVVDVAVPGLDDLLRESSVIGDEFKFDLADYLARQPNPPVKSLGEILERGLHHAQLDQTFRLRNTPETRDTEHYRQALVKRRALRAAVLATLEEQRLEAVAYPTLRRKPALIGEVQIGTTCQLSATSGLPAISMPAGFTVDGLPIGVELLGRGVRRSHAAEVRLRLGAGHQATASAVQHAGAGQRRVAAPDDVCGRRRRRRHRGGLGTGDADLRPHDRDLTLRRANGRAGTRRRRAGTHPATGRRRDAGADRGPPAGTDPAFWRRHSHAARPRPRGTGGRHAPPAPLHPSGAARRRPHQADSAVATRRRAVSSHEG